MSGVEWKLATPVFDSGSGAKRTLLQIKAPTNQRVFVAAFDLSLGGTSVTDAPVPVRVLRQSTAGTGGTALAATKGNDGDNESIQLTALYNTSGGEPTAGDVLYSGLQHPQQARRYGPYWIPGGERLAIEVEPATAVNCTVSATGEE